jgi:hypothetical protein
MRGRAPRRGRAPPAPSARRRRVASPGRPSASPAAPRRSRRPSGASSIATQSCRIGSRSSPQNLPPSWCHGSGEPPLGGFVEEHGAVQHDLAFDDLAHDALVELAFDDRAEELVALELLDLPIVEARAHVALAIGEVFVASGRRLVLEEEAGQLDAPEHQVVGAGAQRGECALVEHLPHARVAVDAVMVDRRSQIELAGTCSVHGQRA